MVFTAKAFFDWLISLIQCFPVGISTLIFIPLALFVIIGIWRWVGEHI